MTMAASKLLGLTLPNGWFVKRPLQRQQGATGGTFSQSYEVVNDGRIGFLKAFDFWEAFEPGIDPTIAIQAMTAAFNFEREVLSHCRTRRLSHVVIAIDHGHVQVPGMGPIEGRVFYLIFEMADGDVRIQVDASTSRDSLWCLKALQGATLGLWQVHRELIAHQDVKPSNILFYEKPGAFKIADFGRASRRGHPIWYDEEAIAGDRTYAPPELLYGFTHTDFVPRRIGCDLYMLGNLACFLFSGANMTAEILRTLDPQHHPTQWNGSYADALPYLQDAFGRVLQNLAPLVDESVRTHVLEFVRELCQPELDRRGHPRGIGRYDQYSLERYVTRLDILVKGLDHRLRTAKKSA